MSYPPYDDGEQHGQHGHPQQPGYPPGSGYTTPSHGHGRPAPHELSDAAIANYLGLICLAGQLFAWIGPLVYRVSAGAHSPYVRASATAALNFHLSVLIYAVAAGVLACAGGIVSAITRQNAIAVVWWLLILVAWLGLTIWQVVASCIGGIRAGRGEIYSYPGSLRLVK